MAEMFVMQRYLSRSALARRGLSHFDDWLRT
jgi:N12 class adenine-specific DNA methylase